MDEIVSVIGLRNNCINLLPEYSKPDYSLGNVRYLLRCFPETGFGQRCNDIEGR